MFFFAKKGIVTSLSNCFCSSYESIVIADFGLATELEKEWISYRCGTPGYMAPEIINLKEKKQEYSTPCDIYSAGLIFYLL